MRREPDRDQLASEYADFMERLETGAVAAEKLRDLSLIDLPGGLTVVIACDSNASNGEKANDTHQNTVEEVSVSALKVPLMEVLAAGARPMVVVNNLCVEMNPYGARLIEGMRSELRRSNLAHVQLTGSTEDNMRTTQTGIGVTVIGLASRERLRIGKACGGDAVVCVGIPQSGIHTPYSEFAPDVAKIGTVEQLARLPYVHEILPIGSKGARYEAGELARVAGLFFERRSDCPVDLETSAGASTAVLVCVLPRDEERLREEIQVPCNRIGMMK